MKERHCKTCGQTGHYAKTCARRATAATSPIDRDVKPENITHEAAATTAATRADRKAEREQKREAARAQWSAEEDARKHRSDEAEAGEHPWSHIDRKGDGRDIPSGYLWRHTWEHAKTGALIVATVPLPASGDPYEHSEGMVVPKRVRDAESVARMLPRALVETFERGARVAAIEPVTPPASLSACTRPTHDMARVDASPPQATVGPRVEVTLASGERATLATYFSHGSWWCEWPAYAYGTTPLRAALFFVANCTNWLVVGLREVAS